MIIFMNKCKFFVAVLVTAMLFCGCSNKVSSDNSTAEEVQEITATPTEEPVIEPEPTEPPTEPEVKIPADSVAKQDGVYVYDNAALFTDEEKQQLTEKLKSLYNDRLINAAVITAAHIGEDIPYSYTEKAYDTLYGSRGSGLVLLINNDTDTDCLYKTGSCSKFISDETEKSEFYWATKDIVSGQFYSAADRMISLGERCPEHIFDNLGLFENDVITELEGKFKELKSDVSLLITTNQTSSSNKDICTDYFKRKYPDGKGYMFMIDTESKTITLVTEEKESSDVKKALETASKSAQKGEYKTAAEELLKGF